MIRILRAFIWLRWRVLVNSLERTTARDTLERFSVATEKLGPIVALMLLIPSTVGLLALAVTAGFGAATRAWGVPLEVIRYFLLVTTALTVFGPIMLPTREGGNAVRFLLLPIARSTLYLSYLAGALADPWVLLALPVAIGVPLGLAIGARPGAALLAALAGVALVVLFTGLTSLASTVIQLLFRNRRRGEIVMLLLVLVAPLIALAPSMLAGDRSARRRADARAMREGHPPTPPRLQRIAARGYSYLPSEVYYRAANAQETPDVVPLAVLAGTGLAIQGLGFVAFRRTLDSPIASGARRAGSFGGLWGRTIPGLSPGASAVAFAQLRLALRTPRGQSIMASPLLLFAIFAVLVHRRGSMPFPGLSIDNGLSLATLGSFVCIFSIMPLSMNQFAIDKGGFTRQMLTPLGIGELLAGKAVGNALIAALPATCCIILPALLFGGGNAALWMALVFALLATYLLVAPAAAALSAMFPKDVDLSSIRNASNAHPAAALLGLGAFAASAGSTALLTLLATRLLHRVELAPVLMLGWCAIAFVISRLLFIPVKSFVASRCEALAQYY